jgi:NitT/TauT family transport system permease protein
MRDVQVRAPGSKSGEESPPEVDSGGATRSPRYPMFQFRGSISRRSYFGVFGLSILLLGAFWYVITSLAIFPQDFFPSPASVAAAAVKMFRSPEFLEDILASAGRIGLAFLLSAVLAIPLGLLMSSFKFVEALVEPIIDFIRYVPVPALIPIFIIWAGIGEAPKLLVLFFGTFFQLVLLIMDDADNAPRLHFDLARTLGASTPQLIRDVLVPSQLPVIYDRLRVTLGWCWTYLIIAELIAVDRGIGHTIKEAQRFNAADQMFVCFIVLGSIGLLTDYVAKIGYRYLFPYTTKAAR